MNCLPITVRPYRDWKSTTIFQKTKVLRLGYFSIANSLRQNFYEDWLAPETVVYDAKIVEKLIKKLKPLAN